MPDWEDYYEILGVHPDASQKEIKKARDDNARIYHEDHMQGLPESTVRRAEEKMKKVNQAYDILGNPEQRKKYHSEWLRRKGGTTTPSGTYRVPKPKPLVDPPHIRFDNVPAKTVKMNSFIIRNEGGPYSKIWFSDPKSWVRVIKFTSLSDSDQLPLQVEIAAEGKDEGETYEEIITVRLDNEETHVKIELRTKPESVIYATNNRTTTKINSALRLQISNLFETVVEKLSDQLGIIIYYVLCIPGAYGSVLLMTSVENFSFVWWLGLLLFIACLPGVIVLWFIGLIIGAALLILWLIILLIQYFIQHPW